LLSDNSLIKQLTEWEPEISLRDGISRTIEWFKDVRNLSQYKWDIYNV